MALRGKKVESIVIIQCKEGYKAHLRFRDKRLDKDMAHQMKLPLYADIEQYLMRWA